jgi:hypothetical protein
MIGRSPPAVYVFAQFSTYSYAERATPAAAIVATGPDHVNALLMIRSPLPTAKRVSSGPRTLSKMIELFWHSR